MYFAQYEIKNKNYSLTNNIYKKHVKAKMCKIRFRTTFP